MNCSEFSRYFSAYLEGELVGRSLLESQAHLEQCKKCSRLVSAYHLGTELLGELPEIEPAADLFERVKQAASAGPEPASLRPARPKYLVPLAAAAVIMLALSVTLFNTFNTARQSQFASSFGSADPTMDLIDVSHTRSSAAARNRAEGISPGISARPVFYSQSTDEVTLSYGVNPQPVVILSGVAMQID